MPFKVLLFITSKPSISHSDFKTHYETQHLPLLQSFAGELFPKSHKRHYRQFGEDNLPKALRGRDLASGFDFDVVAEMAFDDAAAFEAFIEVFQREEVRKVVEEDELLFVERGK